MFTKIKANGRRPLTLLLLLVGFLFGHGHSPRQPVMPAIPAHSLYNVREATELTAIIGNGENDPDNNARAKYNGAAIFMSNQRDFQIGPDAGQIFRIEEDQLDLANDAQFENLQELGKLLNYKPYLNW